MTSLLRVNAPSLRLTHYLSTLVLFLRYHDLNSWVDQELLFWRVIFGNYLPKITLHSRCRESWFIFLIYLFNICVVTVQAVSISDRSNVTYPTKTESRNKHARVLLTTFPLHLYHIMQPFGHLSKALCCSLTIQMKPTASFLNSQIKIFGSTSAFPNLVFW